MLRDSIRGRPRLYIGHEWDAIGIHYLLLEVMRLAVDPAAMNESTALQVTLARDGVIWIEDNGRGIPIQDVTVWQDSDLAGPSLELVLTLIFERHPDRQYYEQFGFLNYLGVVLNAVAAHLEVTTHREDKCYRVVCSRGEIIKHLYQVTPFAEHGTRITFLPDPNLFAKITLDSQRLIEGLRQLTADYPHVRCVFRDEEKGTTLVLP
jgi:DNA gyrase/topoisomerase IV subunit B